MTYQPRPLQLNSVTPIALDDAARVFPTLAQSAAHPSRSAKYQHIETSGILQRMDSAGFDLHSVTIARTRDETRRGFERHLVRWRQRDAAPLNRIGDARLEVVGLNSHDGTSAFELMLGIFRLWCLNGAVVGSTFSSVKIAHKGDIAASVIDGSYRVLSDATRVKDTLETMQAATMSDDAQRDFATRALALRYGDAVAPVSPDALLIPRRIEDRAPDVWTVFNRVQEQLIRGGASAVHLNDRGQTRRRSVRAIRGISQNVAVNRGLFDLALEYAA